MKKLLLNSLTTAFFLSLTVLMACGGKDDDTPDLTVAEEQFQLLEGTWTLSSVTNEGNQVSGWEGFTLTVGGSASSVSLTAGGTQPDGTTEVWSSGNATFPSEDSASTLTRADGVEVAITVSESQLTTSFTIAAAGRAEVVEGAWTFTFTK